MVLRNRYLEKLRKTKGKQIIKAITGVRRCGKSTLLMQFQDELLKSGVKSHQIVSVNFEDLAFKELLDYGALPFAGYRFSYAIALSDEDACVDEPELARYNEKRY